MWRQNYDFDDQRGNLLSRSINNPFNLETFDYDNLDRLNEVLDANQQVKQQLNYVNNNNGNIRFKSDAGEYSYASDKPFAISTLENPQPDVPSTIQQISYTPYNQPFEINENENELKLHYKYGPAEQRCLSELYDVQNVLLKKVLYNGNYEIIESNGNTYEVNYLSSPEGLFAIAVKQNNDPTEIFYVETDHLGSILGLYNASGQRVYAQSMMLGGEKETPKLGITQLTQALNPSGSSAVILVTNTAKNLV